MKIQRVIGLLLLPTLLSSCNNQDRGESIQHRAVLERYATWFLSPDRNDLSYEFRERTSEKSIYILSLADQSVEPRQIEFEVRDYNEGSNQRWKVSTGETALLIPTEVVFEKNEDLNFSVVVEESKIPGFENLGEPDDADNPVNAPENLHNQQDD